MRNDGLEVLFKIEQEVYPDSQAGFFETSNKLSTIVKIETENAESFVINGFKIAGRNQLYSEDAEISAAFFDKRLVHENRIIADVLKVGDEFALHFSNRSNKLDIFKAEILGYSK